MKNSSDSTQFHSGRVTLHHGDAREVLLGLEENSVDSVVTDPPYALESVRKRFGGKNAAPAKHGKDGLFARVSRGFMGQAWDTGDRAFDPEFWAEVLRILKPGGHAFIFGGDRTYHRLACAVEDAGFEIRRMFIWAYGRGYPKSHDISKDIDRAAGFRRGRCDSVIIAGQLGKGAEYERTDKGNPVTEAAREWDGWGTDVKPAVELICLARRPLNEKTVVANVLRWGTGAINVDRCRVGTDGGTKGCTAGPSNGIFGNGLNGNFGVPVQGLGRWPANLLHDNSEEVLACFPASESSKHVRTNTQGIIYGAGKRLSSRTSENGFDDTGSAARFFASFPLTEDDRRIFYSVKADFHDRAGAAHPTVKPVALLQWLVRLITPRDGTCLDPFAGTGTTAEACFRESMRCILIEREDKYIDDIKRRMALMICGPDERLRESIKARGMAADPGPLFRG